MSGKRWVEFVLPVLPGLHYTSASWVIKHKNGLHKIFTRINFSKAPHKVLRLSSVQREQGSQTCASQLVGVTAVNVFRKTWEGKVGCRHPKGFPVSLWFAHILSLNKLLYHKQISCFVGSFSFPLSLRGNSDCWGFLSVIVVLLR